MQEIMFKDVRKKIQAMGYKVKTHWITGTLKGADVYKGADFIFGQHANVYNQRDIEANKELWEFLQSIKDYKKAGGDTIIWLDEDKAQRVIF